jgi:hypothetical protein
LIISRTRAAIGGLLLAGVALPALAAAVQQDHPESILPPGFDQPAPAPAPRPTAAPATVPAPSGATVQSLPAPGATPSADATPGATPTPVPVDLTKYELPDFAKRSLDRVGATMIGNPAFPANGFGHADGRYLSVLMRRLDAPIASRWMSIVLRRALQSPTDTPKNANGADFAAERAWLLLRMGETIAARAVVQDVDTENYTPRLFRVAMQTALATGDPGAMCPLADSAVDQLPDRGWKLAQAMCAGLAGNPNEAGDLLNAARGAGGQGSIDNLLAEKVVGAGGRGAVTIEWDGVDQLNAWRWGLATASGLAVPDPLYRTVGPQVRYWQALAPMLPSHDRAVAAELAAAQGVFSSTGLIDLYSEIETEEDSSSALVAVARDLRTAYTAPQMADRIKALTTLWTEPESQRQRYGRLVLTARAAATIAPDPSLSANADQLVASMLTAGLDSAALKWRGIVARGSDGWAMLALVDSSAGGRVSSSDFGAYRGSADPRKAQLLLAGLAGLGRLDAGDARTLAEGLKVEIGASNAWTHAIDMAARRHDAGSVALLAAAGMQSRGWGAVAPEALFHIVAGLRAVGLAPYARMIAAEAITRA